MKYLPLLLASSFTLPSLADTMVITQNGFDYSPFEIRRLKWGHRAVGMDQWHPRCRFRCELREDGGFYGLLRQSNPRLITWSRNPWLARRWNTTAPSATTATLACSPISLSAM